MKENQRYLECERTTRQFAAANQTENNDDPTSSYVGSTSSDFEVNVCTRVSRPCAVNTSIKLLIPTRRKSCIGGSGLSGDILASYSQVNVCRLTS